MLTQIRTAVLAVRRRMTIPDGSTRALGKLPGDRVTFTDTLPRIGLVSGRVRSLALEHSEDPDGQRHRQGLKHKRTENVARRTDERSRGDRHDAYDPACVTRMSSKPIHSRDGRPDRAPELTPTR